MAGVLAGAWSGAPVSANNNETTGSVATGVAGGAGGAGGATLAQSGDAPARKRAPVEIVRAEIGFGGEGIAAGQMAEGSRSGARALPDRYAPIRLWLLSEKGFSGALVLEHPQDSTQSARVMVPAAATPGVVTPVDAVLCLPRSMPPIKATLIDGNGRRALETELSELPDVDQTKLWGSLDPDHAFVLSVGRSSLSSVVTTTRQMAGPRLPGQATPDEKDWFAKVAVATSEAGDLPRSVGAYDMLEAVVVAPEALGPVDPRVLEAVRRWTLSGGKLVLVVGAGGSAWRSWLPEGDAFSVVEMDAPARMPTPPELRTMLGAMRELAQRRDASLVISESADQVSGRAIRVREAGEREGWRVRWSVGGEKGLLAQGPVGFGFVTILGVEPERLGAVVDARVSRRAWRDALRASLETWRGSRVARTEENMWTMDYTFTASGADMATRIGVAHVLDEMGRAHTINPISFMLISGAMGVLGLLLGVVDYFWLGAVRRRHLGWATALGWIALASGIAVVVPSLIRGGDSAVSRWQVVDLRAPRDAAPSAVATELIAGFVQRRAGVSMEGLPEEGWYRGVSAANSYYGRGNSRGLLLPPLLLRQSPGDPLAGCVPPVLEQPQWTFRAVMGSGPVSDLAMSGVAVRVEFDGATPRVEVEVGEGAVVESGRLELGGEVYELTLSREGGVWRGRGVPSKTLGVFERQALKALATSGGIMNGLPVSESLNLSQRAELSQEARLASGRWARVHLWVKGLATGLKTGIEEKGTMTRVVRALVELPESRRREARELGLTPDEPPVEKGEKELREEKEKGESEEGH